MRVGLARKNDTLDAVLYRELGTSAPLAEALTLNPHLRERGAVLKPGDRVLLPELPETTHDSIHLWD